MMQRRTFIKFLAPAIIAAPNLMKLSHKSSLLLRNPLLVGYKGRTLFDQAAFYAPYTPVHILHPYDQTLKYNFSELKVYRGKEDYRNII